MTERREIRPIMVDGELVDGHAAALILLLSHNAGDVNRLDTGGVEFVIGENKIRWWITRVTARGHVHLAENLE